jgi:hypothetical protein
VIFPLFNILPGGRWLQSFYEALGSYRQKPRALMASMIFSIITQLLTICFFWVAGSALESRYISFEAYAFVVPLGLIAMAAPVAPAGIGVGQAAFFVLFNWYLGFESQVGPAGVTAYQIVQMIWGLLGAYFYFRRKSPVLVEVDS